MDAQVTAMFVVNLIVVITGASKAIAILVSVRDELRDLKRNVGTKDPRDGLLGDVEDLKDDYRKTDRNIVEIQTHIWGRPKRRTDDHAS